MSTKSDYERAVGVDYHKEYYKEEFNVSNEPIPAVQVLFIAITVVVAAALIFILIVAIASKIGV